MPERNDDRQGYRLDTNDPRVPDELTGGTQWENPAYGAQENRRITRRRPAAEEGDSAHQDRRRRAELELEQVEKAYLNERQQVAAQRPPAEEVRRPIQGSPSADMSGIPSVPPSHPIMPPVYGQPPYPERPRQAEPAVVPAYPQSEPHAGHPVRTAQNIQRRQGDPFSPPPSYPISTQGNEIIIDASEQLDAPEQIFVDLPRNREFGGQADILNDEDGTADDTTTLAKGGRRQQARLSTKWTKKRVGKRRYGVFVGSVVLLLATVGLVVVFWSGFTWVQNLINDESGLIAYDNMIEAVVCLDPNPFENITAADPETVLMAAILAAEYESGESGEYDDYALKVKRIPVGEVLSQATRLFGPNCNVRLQSIEDEFNSYTYEENTQEILAPLYGNVGAYQPYTESSRRSGDSVLLRVGYISAANYGEANEQNEEGKTGGGKTRPQYTADQVDKYMEYELKTDARTGQQYIFAIRELETTTPVSTAEDLQ